jgi:hypothetical protein
MTQINLAVSLSPHRIALVVGISKYKKRPIQNLFT